MTDNTFVGTEDDLYRPEEMNSFFLCSKNKENKAKQIYCEKPILENSFSLAKSFFMPTSSTNPTSGIEATERKLSAIVSGLECHNAQSHVELIKVQLNEKHSLACQQIRQYHVIVERVKRLFARYVQVST